MKKLLTFFGMAALILGSPFAASGSRIPSTVSLDQYIDSLYLNYSLGFRSGIPTTEQNVTIDVKEVYFRKELPQYNLGLMIPSYEIAVAQLNANDERGYNYSAGPALKVPLSGFGSHLQLVGHFKMHWLTKHDFGRKRYGGPIQWTYAFGGEYQITKNSYVEYMWEHMSNGDRYLFNPALETHKIAVGINF